MSDSVAAEVSETIFSGVFSSSGQELAVQAVRREDRASVVFTLQKGSGCLLHWGLNRKDGGAWHLPPEACWPAGTQRFDARAVQTPFALNAAGERMIRLDIPAGEWRALSFVLHVPETKAWIKNGNQDFSIKLPVQNVSRPDPESVLKQQVPEAAWRGAFTLQSGERLAAALHAQPELVRVWLACDAVPPLVLHWGLSWQFRHEWKAAPEACWPEGTAGFDAHAARTVFQERERLQCLELEFPKPAEGAGPRSLNFVLYQPEDNLWLKDSGGQEFSLPLYEVKTQAPFGSSLTGQISEAIIGAETGCGSWTLMHRFNLCSQMAAQAQDDDEALALIFVWLRYSQNRQLDWQRNYNTKPRDLSGAQEQLTRRVAGIWKRKPEHRLWLRMILGTLSPGGDGQQVRDEILQIMHRNHIKEVRGLFMEQWHQKLHNNTTPDDVVICQAYLAFLRGNGDLNQFYKTLEHGGVTRERLRSFERPINLDPEFFGHLKDALIRDFENFLRILKSVHSGTDLGTAAGRSRWRLNGRSSMCLDNVFGLRSRNACCIDLAGGILDAREALAEQTGSMQDEAALRDLLFLDISLEEMLRTVVAREGLGRYDLNGLVRLVQLALRQTGLSLPSLEISLCARHWNALMGQPRDREWALHAKSAADRMGRAVSELTDRLYASLQPKAEFLGSAFKAEPWVVSLFGEEVIRGGPSFALSLVLRHLDPHLRRAAGLGGWQAASAASAAGRVRLTESLLAVQDRTFGEPTVLITDKVTGAEEIPQGVTAVLTTSSIDLVSHAAVRARNARVLLATCYDTALFGRLKELNGQTVALRVTPGGDVVCEQTAAAQPPAGQAAPAAASKSGPVLCRAAPPDRWVITSAEFTPERAGGKSNNLNLLRGKLPDWIHFPASLALPFGTFERVLELDANSEVRRAQAALLAEIEHGCIAKLRTLRETLLELAAPEELQSALDAQWRGTGLPGCRWDESWRAIKRVWASKWNERAYLSRRAHGIPHESLRMAVLIQQVVEADYAFVIHTANPLTGDRDELYAEAVLGMGETLVGNYPGRALGFVARKSDLSLNILSYPGKHLGIFGRGVIFRSDSNGEDLEKFAGAGLYDSFLAEEPEHRHLDYSNERLVWDRGFRDNLLRQIARIGLEVEKALGSPQDIEGAISRGAFHVVQTRAQVGLESHA